MSASEKCPVCKASTSYREDSEICLGGEIECNNCGFRCCKKDFLRVSAAMNLAEVWDNKRSASYEVERSIGMAIQKMLNAFKHGE